MGEIFSKDLDGLRQAYEFAPSSYTYEAMRAAMAIADREERKRLAEADDFRLYKPKV